MDDAEDVISLLLNMEYQLLTFHYHILVFISIFFEFASESHAKQNVPTQVTKRERSYKYKPSPPSGNPSFLQAPVITKPIDAITNHERAALPESKTLDMTLDPYTMSHYHAASSLPEVAPGQRAFPYKLYALLEDAEANGFANIISWQPGGLSFRVHQPKLFTTRILHQCFNQTKYKSFLRQLNIYDFHRIQHGPNKGGYAHVHLIRGKPELCHAIVRVFAPTKRKKGGKSSQKARRTTYNLPLILDSQPNPSSDETGSNNWERTSSPQPFDHLRSAIVSQEPLSQDSSRPVSISPIDVMMDAGNGIFTLPQEQQEVNHEAESNFGPAQQGLFAGREFFSTHDEGSSQQNGTVESSGDSVLAGSSSEIGPPQGTGGDTFLCTARDVDVFKDLFQPTDLEQDISFLREETQAVECRPQERGRQRVVSCAEEPQPSSTHENATALDMPTQYPRSDLQLHPPSRVSSACSSESCFLPAPVTPSSNDSFLTKSQQALNSSSNRVSTKNKSLVDWPKLAPTQMEILNNQGNEGNSFAPGSTRAKGSMMMMMMHDDMSFPNEDLSRSESLFPAKLHRMLQDAGKDGFSHIVSWIQGGTAFKVHNVDAFMKHVMTKYFDQSKFQSFRRQLNLYQFTRVNSAVHGTYYFHKCFLQNDPSLCDQIARPRTSRRSRRG